MPELPYSVDDLNGSQGLALFEGELVYLQKDSCRLAGASRYLRFGDHNVSFFEQFSQGTGFDAEELTLREFPLVSPSLPVSTTEFDHCDSLLFLQFLGLLRHSLGLLRRNSFDLRRKDLNKFKTNVFLKCVNDRRKSIINKFSIYI